MRLKNLNVKLKLIFLKYAFTAFVFILVFSLFSCDTERFYERYSEIPEYSWHYMDSIPFYIEINDTNSHYDIYFNIRHTGSYGFRNIWVLIILESPSGALSSNRHEFTLSEPSGKWYGQGIGGIYDAQFPLRKNLKFNEIGDHVVYVKHLMRNDILQEVMNVGIRVDKKN